MGLNASTLLACISCLVAAFAVGVRGMLLSPQTQTWPDAPRPIRIIMFLFMMTLTYRGITMTSHLNDPLPWEASGAALMLAVYQGAMLVNVVRQNYPARVWRTWKRIQHLATCAPTEKHDRAPAYGSNVVIVRSSRR